MPRSPVYLLQHLRLGGSNPETDARLLDRFAQAGDADAFAALMARHGPMVLRLCRRVLADPHAAEDACQATFLVLGRRAGSLRRPEALAGWLYGVAYRIARKARAEAARRQARAAPAPGLDPPDPHPDPLAELSARELLAIVDEEVQRLPEVYRLPVILCCLEGRTREEAARRLGWAPGAVKGRLERGRARLHTRLAQRGLTLSAALVVIEAARAMTARVPATFGQATLRAALTFAATPEATIPAGVSATVAALTRSGLRALGAAKLKMGFAVLLTATVLTTGTGLVTYGPLAAGGKAEPASEKAKQPQGERHPIPPSPAAEARRATPMDAGENDEAAPKPRPLARRLVQHVRLGSSVITVRRDDRDGRVQTEITVEGAAGTQTYTALDQVPPPYRDVAKALLERAD